MTEKLPQLSESYKSRGRLVSKKQRRHEIGSPWIEVASRGVDRDPGRQRPVPEVKIRRGAG
jgi:hypothetical protein